MLTLNLCFIRLFVVLHIWHVKVLQYFIIDRISSVDHNGGLSIDFVMQVCGASAPSLFINSTDSVTSHFLTNNISSVQLAIVVHMKGTKIPKKGIYQFMTVMNLFNSLIGHAHAMPCYRSHLSIEFLLWSLFLSHSPFCLLCYPCISNMYLLHSSDSSIISFTHHQLRSN